MNEASFTSITGRLEPIFPAACSNGPASVAVNGCAPPMPNWLYCFFSMMLLPNTKPISALARNWLSFKPAGPNT